MDSRSPKVLSTAKKEPVPDDKVEVEKENIAEMQEEIKPPKPVVEHHGPGVYSEHHDTTYDESVELAFKKKTDAGTF